jgi:DNA-binding response OmpR family regulator
MKKLLLAENNQDFAYVLKWHFEQTGFEIYTSTKGEDALNLFKINQPDIILLDINLDGDITGKDVAREVRKIDKITPIIFMSGESKSPTDVVEGFNIGCNFFLKKPLSIDEIDVHVNAVLNTSITKNTYKFNHCTFNPSEKSLFQNGSKETLSEKECQVLQVLADHCSQAVNLTYIMETVWQDTLMEESLRNIVSSLRKKIKGKGLQIETIKGVGYKLEDSE